MELHNLIDKAITGFLLYLCSIPFFFLIGAGSIYYFAAKYKPSFEQIRGFLQYLKFPFTLVFAKRKVQYLEDEQSEGVWQEHLWVNGQ
jgi:hypothetical protein